MSKTKKRPEGGSLSPSKEGSDSRPLSPSRGGPSRVEDIGMAALNWLAGEMGLPVGDIISALEANPALIESAGRAAQAQTLTPRSTGPSSTPSGSGGGTGSPGDPLGLLVTVDDPLARLWIPEVRPSACQIAGSQAVQTPGMFTIELSKYDIRIYNSIDQQITRIWGDPHVNENGGGDNWHFGNNSTFVLTDGTKICLDTEQNAGGEWLVEGVDIIAGNDRYHFGTGDTDGLHQDALEWDKANADVAAGDESAGMFALKPDGTWAMQGQDGHFYDVKDESWGSYQSSNDVDIDASKRTDLTSMQKYATLFDHMPGHIDRPRGGQWDSGPDASSDFKTMKLKVPKQRPRYVKYRDSSIVMTPLGYLVEMRNTEVLIYDISGKQITRIWGDPHVNEKEGGDNWHFGGNSTFILPDGAKIRCDTEPIRSNFWVVVGVDVLLGDSRFSYKKGGEGALSEDGRQYDRDTTDADKRTDAGIFALTPSGEWAVMARDGFFYDITDESWEAYKRDPDVDLSTTKRVNVTTQQNFASRSDQLPAEWQMEAIGNLHEDQQANFDSDIAGHMAALAAILPAKHMDMIREHAPNLFAALANDHTLAQFIANMPDASFQLLIEHAPDLFVAPIPSDAPKDAAWPGPAISGRAQPKPAGWWT